LSRPPRERKTRSNAGASRAASSRAAQVRQLEFWELRLYVAGQTPNSIEAFANLRQICDIHLAGKYSIQVIDLVRNPQLV
jgi:circadian clock protein KaiB